MKINPCNYSIVMPHITTYEQEPQFRENLKTDISTVVLRLITPLEMFNGLSTGVFFP
jgi:hypothetical protein